MHDRCFHYFFIQQRLCVQTFLTASPSSNRSCTGRLKTSSPCFLSGLKMPRYDLQPCSGWDSSLMISTAADSLILRARLIILYGLHSRYSWWLFGIYSLIVVSCPRCLSLQRQATLFPREKSRLVLTCHLKMRKLFISHSMTVLKLQIVKKGCSLQILCLYYSSLIKQITTI